MGALLQGESQPGSTVHSAWELYDERMTAAEIDAEYPKLDNAALLQLLQDVELAAENEAFAIFHDPPDPTTSFPGRENGVCKAQSTNFMLCVPTLRCATLCSLRCDLYLDSILPRLERRWCF